MNRWQPFRYRAPSHSSSSALFPAPYSVVVHYLHFVGVSLTPNKADTPLIVDANAVLPVSVSSDCLDCPHTHEITEEPCKVLQCRFMSWLKSVRIEVHHVVPNLPDGVQMLSERYSVNRKPQSIPIFRAFQQPKVVSEGQICCALNQPLTVSAEGLI